MDGSFSEALKARLAELHASVASLHGAALSQVSDTLSREIEALREENKSLRWGAGRPLLKKACTDTEVWSKCTKDGRPTPEMLEEERRRSDASGNEPDGWVARTPSPPEPAAPFAAPEEVGGAGASASSHSCKYRLPKGSLAAPAPLPNAQGANAVLPEGEPPLKSSSSFTRPRHIGNSEIWHASTFTPPMSLVLSSFCSEEAECALPWSVSDPEVGMEPIVSDGGSRRSTSPCSDAPKSRLTGDDDAFSLAATPPSTTLARRSRTSQAGRRHKSSRTKLSLASIASLHTNSSVRSNASNAMKPIGSIQRKLFEAKSREKTRKHIFKLVEVLPIWQDPGRHQSCVLSFNRPNSWDQLSDVGDDGHHTTGFYGFLYRRIAQPTSSKRILWDLMSMSLIAWDGAVIPMQVFDHPHAQFLTIMLWFSRLFWLCDVPASLLTGFLSESGDVEMDPVMIAHNYTRTWLVPDMVMVGADWLEVCMNALKGARTVRLLRLFRLIRIVKIPDMIALIGERIWSEQVMLVVSVLKIVGLVLGIAHLIACLWYGVARMEENADSNWVEVHGFAHVDQWERYAMSFHWSLAQFVGGMEIVQPQNIRERSYAIVVVLFTFVISSAVVSSITSSMTRLQFIAKDRAAQLSALRRYLQVHGISRRLMVRIQRNAEHAMQEKVRNRPEEEVDMLQIISEPLRVELHFEEHFPLLRKHPFFEYYSLVNTIGTRKLCHLAVSEKILWHGDLLFSAGETSTAPTMYFVRRGNLDYRHEQLMPMDVHPGQWVSEPSLWVTWMHRGDLRAISDCHLVGIPAAAFQDITSNFKGVLMSPAIYALEYVQRVNDSGCPTDIGDHALSEDIVLKVYNLEDEDPADDEGDGHHHGHHHQKQSVSIPSLVRNASLRASKIAGLLPAGGADAPGPHLLQKSSSLLASNTRILNSVKCHIGGVLHRKSAR